MNESDPVYDIAAIRNLLLAAFDATTLLRFCQDRPLFRPLLVKFGLRDGFDVMVDRVIDYCDRERLWSDLLAAIRKINEPQYQRFEPYILDTPGPAQAWRARDRYREYYRPGTPFTVPQLPERYVERRAELQRLKDRWLPAQEGARLPFSQALLHGIAAVGKSTLAAAWARDEAVQRRFPDGVLWVTLGVEPDLPQRLGDWGRALGDPLLFTGVYPDAQAGSNQLRTLLQDKACLLVVDDAWKREHVIPFEVGGGRCLLVVTSRSEEVLPGADRIPLDEMREAEALELMANWAGEIAPADRPTAAWLAGELGYLPLALELSGAQARELGGWPAFRALWEEEKLAAIARGWDPDSPRDSLLISLDLSWQALQENARQPYLQLAVFGGDTLFPTGAAAALWGRSEPQANKLLTYLASQAMLTRREVDGVRCYTFHDVLYELVSGRLGEEGRTRAHEALVAGYRARCGGQWAALPDDRYVHSHLAGHMAGAGLYDDVGAVALDERWRESQREAHKDSRATLNDLQLVLDLALARDDLVTALDCVATHRETAHHTSIVDAIYRAVDEGDLSRALSLAPLKGPVEDWGGALYHYLAWEAALAGEEEISRETVAQASQWRVIQAGDLWDALLVRAALALAGGDPARTRQELAAFGRPWDGESLVERYAPGRPVQGQDVQQVLDRLEMQMSFLTRALSTLEIGAVLDPWAERFTGDEMAVDWGDAAGPGPEEQAAYAAEIRDQLAIVAELPGGREFIERLLATVEMNLYPRYRDVGLIECGIACLRVPDDGWVRGMLRRIIGKGLDREGVVSTFDLPLQLLAAARRQEVRAPALERLSEYAQLALGRRDRWGTRLRALSAQAAALHRDGRKDEALEALREAGSEPLGYAGYGALHMLALANRWREFSDLAPGDALIDEAWMQAQRVRNERFREDRIELVGAFAEWWKSSRMEPERALAALAEIDDSEVRLVFLEHLSARWASAAEGPDWQGLKRLLPEVLVHGTGSFRDAILGRLFGVYLAEHKLADSE
ncbi:MAG TPA: NB-ARC domain-containing protein, partial [Anaerolineae bacterium]|nr:NB-ARC domain-containing protein [Anaerolineae bacterium]